MRRSLAISAAAVALALPAVAGAAPRQIDIGDDFFAPKRPPARNLQAGPSFRWSNGGVNGHNVRQDDKLFFSGNPTTDPFQFAINASAGSYHYYCTRHGTRQLGMTGVVKVRPIAEVDSISGEIEVLWASSATDTGSRFDVRYRVDQRKWKTWRNDTPSFQAAFGHNDHPVDYRPNSHTYKIKVRSERRRVKKHSDWSPPLTL